MNRPAAYTLASARRRRRAGFTLVELVLVLVVLCVVLGMAVPQLKGFLTGSSTRDAATQLVALTQYARGKAAAESRTYRLTFDPAAGEYQLTAQEAGNGGAFAPLGSDFGRTFTLPTRRTVELTRPGAAGTAAAGTAGPNDIDFRPDGSCDPAVIRLTDGDGIVTLVAAPSPAEPFRLMTAQEVDAI